MSKLTPTPSVETIQNTNWSGSIPILLSLAPTSLSSPIPPQPLHKLVPRSTFLHLGLYHEIWELFHHAPVSSLGKCFSNDNPAVSREEPPDSPSASATAAGQSSVDDGKGQQTDGIHSENMKIHISQTAENITRNNKIENSCKNGNDSMERNCQKVNLSFPECWFEDEESGTPLRWHLFLGVLYDLMKGTYKVKSRNQISSSQYDNFLPWKIRLHFNSYPTDRLLPMKDCLVYGDKSNNKNSDDDESVGKDKINRNENAIEELANNPITLHIARTFRNSLKQSLFLQYGSSKAAMSISKNSHVKLWNGVLRSKFELYQEVNRELQRGVSSKSANSVPCPEDGNQNSDTPKLIPVRVLVNGSPAIQKPCRVYSKREFEKENHPDSGDDQEPIAKLLSRITPKTPSFTTLGEILADWLPHLFVIDSTSGCVTVISQSTTYFSIQGVQPSLDCNLVDLWRCLCNPDHFLYIVVVVAS
ncbi:hypothetical protein ACHAXS_014421 [Conticribra weissflogii]